MKRIIWATDFSVAGDAALAWAERLAGPTKARVIGIHVVPVVPVAYGGLGFDYSVLSDVLIRQKEAAMDTLKDQLHGLQRHGQESEASVEEGGAVTRIVETAEEKKADLIVMGTRSLSPLKRFFVGSTAIGVIRTSKVPVLTVRRRPGPGGVRRILVTTDLSAASWKAYRFARALADRHGAELHLLHVVELYDYQILKEEWNTLATEIEKKLWRRVAGTSTEPRLAFAPDAAEGIMRYANRHPADLIVMATHGLGRATRWLLGSVCERMVRDSATPVLVVRG